MCGNYSREETIQGRKLYGEIRYSFFCLPGFFYSALPQNTCLHTFCGGIFCIVAASPMKILSVLTLKSVESTSIVPHVNTMSHIREIGFPEVKNTKYMVNPCAEGPVF